MKSGKKIVVALLIILILLLLAGGVFAYVYIATDLLRTDKEMFFKSLSQITLEDGFINKEINDFHEKKKQTPYENSGEIAFDVEYPDEELEKVIEKVNDLTINFSGKTNLKNEKVEQNIQVDYGNNIVFPVKYKQDGNKFGLQFDKLSKKYIAIKNDNLDEFFRKLLDDEDSISSNSAKIAGILDIVKTPSEIIEKMKFTEEEKNELGEIYEPVLSQYLLDEYFTSAKMGETESYTLALTGEQIKNITVKLLEATKQNTLILDIINGRVEEIVPEAEKLDVTIIDEMIENINEEDVSEIPNLKYTLILNNKKLNQIVSQSGESQVAIEKIEIDNKLTYNINLNIKQEITGSNSSLLEENTKLGKADLLFKVQFEDLDSLSNVKENYEIGFDLDSDEQAMKYNYKINTNTEFKESISIEELNENVAVFLNNQEKEQIISFLTQVGTRLGEVNKNQMNELGLKEYENPLLYTNPITVSGIMIYNTANKQIMSSDLSEYEIQVFNEKFIRYEGESVESSDVNALIQTVSNHNLSTELENQSDKYVKVTIDGNEVDLTNSTYSIESGKIYVVEAIYNLDGYVSEMKITTKN